MSQEAGHGVTVARVGGVGGGFDLGALGWARWPARPPLPSAPDGGTEVPAAGGCACRDGPLIPVSSREPRAQAACPFSPRPGREKWVIRQFLESYVGA